MKNFLLLLAGIYLAVTGYSQSARPDLSFGNGGTVLHSSPAGFTSFRSLALQNDGKIVAVGFTTETDTTNFLVARYNADGTLDNSFDGDGKLRTDFGAVNANASDIVIQRDGKILVVGQGYGKNTGIFLELCRYNTDGSLDNGFNGNGKVADPNFTSTGGSNYLDIQTDGKIVVAGSYGIKRYNENGSTDNNFGTNGIVHTLSDIQSVYSIAIQPDGKILAGGYSFRVTGDFVLLRYNSDGSPDLSFDGDGKVFTDIGASDELRSIAIQPDGKIVVAGSTMDNTTNHLMFAVARYNTDGSADNSFDGDGKLITDFGSNPGVYQFQTAISIRDDGKIIVAGVNAVARYNLDGSLDNSFDGDGKTYTHFINSAIPVITNNKLFITGDAYPKAMIEAYMLEDAPPTGLYYRYYEGSFNALPDFNNLTPVKTGSSANIDMSVRTPGRNDNFAFIWQGYINITTPGNYTFETVSDDGSKVYFNSSYSASGIALVNNDGLHAPVSATGMVNIPAAGMYPITFTFFEKDGGESMQAYWTGPGITRQLIPDVAFTTGYTAPHVTGGLNYKYYEGSWSTLPDFNTLTPVKTGNSANVDLSVRTPGRNDNFAFVWEGYINIQTAGLYTFETISDDGSRLYFNTLYNPSAAPTVNNDGIHAPVSANGSVNITSPGLYPISITFFEKDGGESMQVYWTGPGIPRQLIPNSAFTQSVTTGGLNYKYYEGTWSTLPDFSTLTPVKTGSSPNLDLSTRTPGRNDNFAFVWEGNFTVPTPGDYTLELVSDDGSKFYYNTLYAPAAAALINNDGLHALRSASATVNITSTVPVAITYFEKDGDETMQLYWTGPGIPRQLVPSSAFTQASSSSATAVEGNAIIHSGSTASDDAISNTKIYPNPFAERFTIDFNNNPGDVISINIYDLTGRKVFNQHPGNLNAGKISLPVNLGNKNIKPGIYLVSLNRNGIPLKTIKLIKEK